MLLCILQNYHSPASENIPNILTTSGWFVDQVTDNRGNVPKIIGEISGTPTYIRTKHINVGNVNKISKNLKGNIFSISMQKIFTIK